MIKKELLLFFNVYIIYVYIAIIVELINKVKIDVKVYIYYNILL
jgi:hypothetical protein